MAAITNNKKPEYYWTASEVFFSLIMGIAAVVGIWISAGLLIGFFG